MTDDSTSTATVSDDEIGSLEDRSGDHTALALSHPPFRRLGWPAPPAFSGQSLSRDWAPSAVQR